MKKSPGDPLRTQQAGEPSPQRGEASGTGGQSQAFRGRTVNRGEHCTLLADCRFFSQGPTTCLTSCTSFLWLL